MTKTKGSSFRLRPLGAMSDYLNQLVEAQLWAQVLVGMFAGVVVGVAIGPAAGWLSPSLSLTLGNWLAFPGQLFLLSIQMIVVPLVFASIVRGLAAGPGGGQLRRLALWTIGFFCISTAIAAAIGIAVAVWIAPGSYLVVADPQPITAPATASGLPTLDALPATLLSILPGNPLHAFVEGQMLQVVLFAFVIAVATLSLPAATVRPIMELLTAVQEVCMTVVRWAMKLAPFAVFGLMAQLVSRTGWQTLLGLGVYAVTVLLGLLVVVAAYLLVLRLTTDIGPIHFLRRSRDLLLLAFSTSSSAAVMPMSMRVANQELGLRSGIAQFVLPLGATINMNGTALYQSVAAVFLAQAHGVDIGVGGLILVVAMAVGASIGSPATPGVGIVILASILTSIGVPPSGVALIMGLDRLLDMCRTAVNVAGDLVACAFVDKWVMRDFQPPTSSAQPTGGVEPTPASSSSAD